MLRLATTPALPVYQHQVRRPLRPIITQWSSFAMLHLPDQATSTSQSTGHCSTGQYRMAAPHRPNQDAGPLRYQAPLLWFSHLPKGLVELLKFFSTSLKAESAWH
ncbi:hypothetical protein BKA70DRAFT_1427588 [Coprinopsis sp. MPI-PUGE-AT-0042]|nr:hypothetical protein BKA70DRAFT_1427588 [Coprinopsis sp. MPI-PUGE-AT-0042]